MCCIRDHFQNNSFIKYFLQALQLGSHDCASLFHYILGLKSALCCLIPAGEWQRTLLYAISLFSPILHCMQLTVSTSSRINDTLLHLISLHLANIFSFTSLTENGFRRINSAHNLAVSDLTREHNFLGLASIFFKNTF